MTEYHKLEKMKRDRQRIIRLFPAIGVVILFFVMSVYFEKWNYNLGKDMLFHFFLPQLAVIFIPVFVCTYIIIMIYREGKIKPWLMGVLFGLIFAVIAMIPEIKGHPELLFKIINICFGMIPVLLAYIVYLAFDWFRVSLKVNQLEQQNLRSELAVLKNQINPHFLFNTLNNIDSLIKSDPNKASVSLVELSDMMRYMLYDSDTDKVFLKDDIRYIENYLHLQALQYANKELVEYTVSGEIGLKRVAPMIFIPFIENAFKHCTDKNIKHAIRFCFTIEEDYVKFESINIYDKKKQITKDSSSGAGLEIVSRRLELIYPNRYSLNIDDNNGFYSVELIIRYAD